MRDVDVEGHESKYYEIIKNIIEYNFSRNKNLKTVLFDCDWFDPNHGTPENKFVMVEASVAWLRPICPCSPGRASLLYAIPMQKAKCVVGGV
jgi:hypothetical protein